MNDLGPCRLNGWTEGESPLVAVLNGGVKLYEPAILSKSKFYALALLFSATIFRKHVPYIAHDGSEAYYRCLLLLPAEKLTNLVNLNTYKKCQQLLKDTGAQLPLCAIVYNSGKHAMSV